MQNYNNKMNWTTKENDMFENRKTVTFYDTL